MNDLGSAASRQLYATFKDLILMGLQPRSPYYDHRPILQNINGERTSL
jgi:hypothetical protein